MNRTIGVRLGPKLFIKYVMNQLERNKRFDENITIQNKYVMAMHHCINIFFQQDLKISKDDYKKIKIEHIIENDDIDCDLVYIVFKTLEDVTKVNSQFKNLNDGNRNKISQYVPKEFRKRYKAFETVAFNLRQEKSNNVTTKIRASKNDLILLVRKKNEKTSWNQIEPITIPIEVSKQARFEIGRLSNEDYIKEGEQLQNVFDRNKENIERRNYYVNNHKSMIDFPENDEYFNNIFPDSLPEFNGVQFEEDILQIHCSTILEDMETNITSNKRNIENLNDTSLNKKSKPL